MTLQDQLSALETDKRRLELEAAPLYARLMEIQAVERKALDDWCQAHDRLKNTEYRISVIKQMLESFEQEKEQSECKTKA